MISSECAVTLTLLADPLELSTLNKPVHIEYKFCESKVSECSCYTQYFIKTRSINLNHDLNKNQPTHPQNAASTVIFYRHQL